jgi:chloramphenicol 3-O phosphotransferase
MNQPGQIIVLNGVPRSGKTSIARAIQDTFPGIWMNLGVDAHMSMMPKAYLPGIGLRPGGERPDLERHLPGLYAALYESIAAHSRFGFNVVADMGHHDGYSRPLGILADCAGRLAGLPVLFVGVCCPVDTIMERRRKSTEGAYVTAAPGEAVPAPVMAWQEAVHGSVVYDVTVDTSQLSPPQCAETIAAVLRGGVSRPTAFERLAGRRAS